MKLDQVADDINVKGEKFSLMELPYGRTKLEPYMSRDTLDLHYGKHHAGYVDKLNELIKGTEYENMSLKELIIASRDTDDGIFNNAGQNYNHVIFWQSMTPTHQEPSQELLSKINESFGSMDEFVTQFIDAGTKRFGSGWVWLVLENNKMKWKTTANADNPIGDDVEVLAGCDVWEHSYYLDYKNDRKKYLETWIKNLINFEFIQSRLFEL
jgi:superoxide dismutase, Fe-Mn family